MPQADADNDGNVEIAEFLGLLLDCATIDQSLVPICEGGLQFAGDFFERFLVDANSSDELLTLEGSVKVDDVIVDLRADYLYDGVWDGRFGGDAAALLTEDIGTLSWLSIR